MTLGPGTLRSIPLTGTNAPWGELSTVAKRNGAAGCICDSNIGDCRKIAMEFRFLRVFVRSAAWDEARRPGRAGALRRVPCNWRTHLRGL
jgi:hypothetical protein